MPTPNTGYRRLGRPREASLNTKILEATYRIIENGQKVSVDAVVEESGTSRASVYRRWPSLNNLITDALDDGWCQTEIAIDPSKTIKEGFINAFFNKTSPSQEDRYSEQRFRRRIELTMSDPKLQQIYWNSHVQKRREYPLQALQIAKDRGEIRPNVDIEAALDTIYGVFYYQFLVRGQDISSKEVKTRTLAAFELVWKGMEP